MELAGSYNFLVRSTFGSSVMGLKREALSKRYSPSWVAKLTDAQVHIVYMRLLAKKGL